MSPNPDFSSAPDGCVVSLFQPSLGLGGGVERQCEALGSALQSQGVEVRAMAMLGPGDRPTRVSKARFVLRVGVELWRRRRRPGPVIVGHPGLAPAIAIWRLIVPGTKLNHFVLFHGEDIWNGKVLRRMWLRFLRARLVTVSSFSAGALASLGKATVLSPRLPDLWRDALLALPDRTTSGASVQVLTVFRLADADGKGLPALLDALGQLIKAGTRLTLTVAGSGRLPDRLAGRMRDLTWAQVIADPSDRELARLYSEADLFVLATRLRLRPPTSGEGFGLVLLEAQLAGLAVVAPAFGGSDDAFAHGFTGLRPIDESAEALATTIGLLLDDCELRTRMAANARQWATAVTDPRLGHRRVAEVFLA